MATIVKVKRLSNPRRVVTRRKPRANPKHRTRKMTPKQVKYFGSARQKAALKRSRAAKRVAPVHRPRTVSNRRRAKRRSTNPAWIVTLGPAVNPRKKRSTMAAKAHKRRKARKVTVNRKRRRVVARNPRHHVVRHRRRTRRSNPKVVVRYRTRRHNRRRHAVRRHNPSIFGARLGSKESMKLIGGGLTGVVATKFLPTLIPTTMMPQLATTNLGRTAISAAAWLVSGWVASKIDVKFSEGVYFGGAMQVASVALNAFLPAVYKTLGIGLGDFVPGQFAVPQNPVRAAIGAGSHMPAVGGSLVRTSSLGRAYAPAY